MNDIDLIPAEFRQIVARLHELRLYTISAVALGLFSVVGGWSLMHWAGTMDQSHKQLMQQHALSNHQSDELTRLSDQRNKLLKQRDTLTQLRGGGAASDLIMVVDRALPGEDVWFQNWRFAREHDDESGILSVGNSGSSNDPTTRMNITGQSIDHAALSRFVRALYQQTEVVDVKLRQTTVRRYHTYSVIDFELTVLLRAGA